MDKEFPNIAYLSTLAAIKHYEMKLTLWEVSFINSLLKRKIYQKQWNSAHISISKKEKVILKEIAEKIWKKNG